ncbi:MAG: hypothetical protein WCK29_03950 [archaeon]
MSQQDDEIERLRETAQTIEKNRKGIHMYIPAEFRFPFAWTIFFAIFGICLQSIKTKSFAFIDFFGNNYMVWFNNFGNFSSAYEVSGMNEVLRLIANDWYYFFFTGGLIAILWALIYWAMHIELRSRKDDFYAGNI